MFTYNTLGRIKGDATLSLIDSRPLFFVLRRAFPDARVVDFSWSMVETGRICE
jgi:hypothetical protein